MTTIAGPVTAEEFASLWEIGLRSEDIQRDRTQQSKQGITGASDIGVCREKTRLHVTEAPRTDADNNAAAYIGTLIHEGALAAYGKAFPHVLIEQAVVVTLPSGRTVPGHADIIDPTEPSCTDLKTVDGLEYHRKNGPYEQQRIQRTLYALGAWQAGLFGDIPVEEVIVRNLWLDRSGGTSEVVVDQELFDWQWIHKADEWLSDVIYAVEHGEAASKDKPIPWCQSFCPFYSSCRAVDVEPASVITDPEIVQAAYTYREALEAEKAAAQLKKEAAARLEGIDGQAGEYRVRHIFVNGSHVSFDRKPTWRLEVQPVVKKAKGAA